MVFGKKTSKKTEKVSKQLVNHVAIVLDRSGSMSGVREETIKGFNEQVGVIHEANTNASVIRTNITLTLFDTNVEVREFESPVSSLPHFTREDYVCGGYTAMLDAVGVTVDKLEEAVKDGEPVLVVIISDGAENASKRFTYEDISRKVQRLEGKNWTFTYIGSNQDLSKVQENLGLRRGNVASYVPSVMGTTTAFSTTAGSVSTYMNNVNTLAVRSSGGVWNNERGVSNFYNEDDEIKTLKEEKNV